MISKSALAIFPHPDDIEFYAAGPLLAWSGNRDGRLTISTCTPRYGGSVVMDAATTAATRLREAAGGLLWILDVAFHPPICHDLELTYSVEFLRRIVAVVSRGRALIVLTHAPQDYMEDHIMAVRLAVTAAFCHGVPELSHALRRVMPISTTWPSITHTASRPARHPLRRRVRAGAYVNTTRVHQHKNAGVGRSRKARSTGWTSARARNPTSPAWMGCLSRWAVSQAALNTQKAGADICTWVLAETKWTRCGKPWATTVSTDTDYESDLAMVSETASPLTVFSEPGDQLP